MKVYKHFFKRPFDLLASLAGLILISPVFLFILFLLLITNSGKPFFFQARPGRNQKIFKIVKFKTMNDKTDKLGNLLPDKYRLTKTGRIIRKTSLDEIPQLINVLKGEMSLVGPRPLLIQYLPFYTERERKRHEVRPGITGLAQINGRNNLSWDKRLALDAEYVEKLTFLLDLNIIIKTIINVFTSKDINVLPGDSLKNLDDERRT